MIMRRFSIPIKVEDESELYDRFVPSGQAFSGELVSYLADCIEDRNLGENILIELHASEKPDMERFRNTYNAFVDKLIRRNSREIRKVDFQAVLSMAFGVLVVSAGFALEDRISRVLAEILGAGGSFALWAAIASFLETLPTLRYRKKLLQFFLKAEICYIEEAGQAETAKTE